MSTRQSAIRSAQALAKSLTARVLVWCAIKDSKVIYQTLSEGRQPAQGYVVATVEPTGVVALRP